MSPGSPTGEVGLTKAHRVGTVETTLRGMLKYGGLGRKRTDQPANFVLFPPGRPALEVVDQLGESFDTDPPVSYVNLEVEVRGREVAKTFRLIQIRKLTPRARPRPLFILS